ncbi:hypothetical protein PIB30_095642 [Stylosanthes scabra]|uniref:Ubiquitin-like protease family profile domain-containing protein n=1 Tax=Stylosanthes scabra TaxID=79078 RepID=A0ABU6WVM7_9FABA|nr:hypothetical protein [Stylosanthes scabra]
MACSMDSQAKPGSLNTHNENSTVKEPFNPKGSTQSTFEMDKDYKTGNYIGQKRTSSYSLPRRTHGPKIPPVLDFLAYMLTQEHKKLVKLPTIWFLPTIFSANFIEKMLRHKSFYASTKILVPKVSKFEIVEPSNLPQQRRGSNDCGIWVAYWMKECGLADNFNIMVSNSHRMRLAIDLITKEFNIKKLEVMDKAHVYMKDIQQKNSRLQKD